MVDENRRTEIEIDRHDDDGGSRWVTYLPITLRQVEAAGVILDGSFGIDAAEHAELLDDQTILRLACGAEFDAEALYDREATPNRYMDIEVYQARLLDSGGPRWESVVSAFPEGHHAAGYKERNASARNMHRLSQLVDSIPEAQAACDEIEALLAVAMDECREGIDWDQIAACETDEES